MGYKVSYIKDGQVRVRSVEGGFYEAVRKKNKLRAKGFSVEIIPTGIDAPSKHYIETEGKTDKQLISDLITRLGNASKAKGKEERENKAKNKRNYQKKKKNNNLV